MEERSVVALYVVSQNDGMGKTALSAGIGRHLIDGGKRVGYFKPTPRPQCPSL